MKDNAFVINRAVKARALDALAGNFFSILKIMVLPMLLMVVANTFDNYWVTLIVEIISGLFLIGAYPLLSTLMTLQERQPAQARAYAKSWSWFILFRVWRNRGANALDLIVVSGGLTMLLYGTLITTILPMLTGVVFEGFGALGVMMSLVLLILWFILLFWVSVKLSFLDFVFADAIFGDMTTTAFNDVDFAAMPMGQRLSVIIRTTWSLMTWSVFWRYVWFGLTFVGWLIFGIFTLGLGLLFVGPYLMMATVSFYERIIGEKYGFPEFEDVEEVTINTELM